MNTPDGLNARTILIVDDDASIRAIERRYLVPAGYRVLETGNGREAIALIESGAVVDLVISDMVMPDMDGEEMVSRLRRNRPLLKVLFVTGRIDLVMNARPLADVEAYLNKPFAGAQLIQAVSQLLSGTANPA